MIKTTIVGNIGKDAVSQKIGGKTYAKFSIAADKYKSGEQEVTEWIDCLKLDEDNRLTSHLTKGKPLYLEGKLRANAYLKDGEAKANMTLWVSSLGFISTPKAEVSNSQAASEDVEDPDFPF